jgi:NtrC-family two-component system response regulator AlgB
VFDLVFLDLRLGVDNGLDFLPAIKAESPWAQVIVITAYASIETAIEAMKRGASDYLPKPFEPSQVQLVTQKVAERRQMELKIEAMQSQLGAMDAEADLPTNTPAMLEVIELARQVAPSRAPVLIRGEPGTGKGRLARAIHAWSSRAEAQFQTVSCQQSVDELEAELFGLAPSSGPMGAERPARVVLCDGGTLLLKEIDQTPLHPQTKLLRLLRDHEYERVDDMRPRTADVRIIASTSADLPLAVREGKFRHDLLMCLGVVEIVIPPLRSRGDDIPLLADRYLAFFGREHNRRMAGISDDALYAMRQYYWPGNGHELRNVIERAVLLCRGAQIGIEHLPPNLLNAEPAYRVGDLVPLETIKKSHVMKVVASTRSLRRAAWILGVDPSSLCRWMQRYGIKDDQPAA